MSLNPLVNATTGAWRYLLLTGVVLAFLALPAVRSHAKDQPASTHEDTAHTSAEHGAAHGEHHVALGEPAEKQKPLDWRADLAVYSLIVFVVLMAILTTFAWGPLMGAIDAREAAIRQSIESAEETHRRAEAMLAEHARRLDAVQDEVREILAEARRDAEHTKNEIVASAQKESQLLTQRSLEEIGRARDQALDELFHSMSNSVASAAETVIGRSLSDDDRRRLVSEALNSLST